MRIAFTLTVFLTISAICTAQTTWYVPDDFSKIQGAISDTSVLDGDTIVVRPGTYTENLAFLGKAITLVSERGPDVTVIDGQYPTNPDHGSVIRFINNETAASLVDGFTLRGGTGTKYTSSPIHDGGGIFCMNASPVIKNNIIIENYPAGHGGGIYCNGESTPLILSNRIIENEATGNGGGIYCNGESTPLILSNRIIENKCDSHGGGISLSGDSSAIISNNIIARNEAGFWGGGVYMSIAGNPVITNCCLLNNKALMIFAVGNAIYVFQSKPTITNSIIGMNSNMNQIYVDYYCPPYHDPPGILTISHSLVVGGKAVTGSEYPSVVIWDNATMIDRDPQFVDFTGDDFHILHTSPCKDTGLVSSSSPLQDIEGDPRVAYGAIDMGADEFHPHLYYAGDATPSGTIQAKCIGIPGSLINGIILGVNIFDPPLSCDYGLWYMDNPMQIIPGLGLIPINGVAVFPGTIPVSPPAPYTIYLQAAIDSWLTNLCSVDVQ